MAKLIFSDNIEEIGELDQVYKEEEEPALTPQKSLKQVLDEIEEEKVDTEDNKKEETVEVHE